MCWVCTCDNRDGGVFISADRSFSSELWRSGADPWLLHGERSHGASMPAAVWRSSHPCKLYQTGFTVTVLLILKHGSHRDLINDKVHNLECHRQPMCIQPLRHSAGLLGWQSLRDSHSSSSPQSRRPRTRCVGRSQGSYSGKGDLPAAHG